MRVFQGKSLRSRTKLLCMTTAVLLCGDWVMRAVDIGRLSGQFRHSPDTAYAQACAGHYMTFAQYSCGGVDNGCDDTYQQAESGGGPWGAGYESDNNGCGACTSGTNVGEDLQCANPT